MIFGCVDAIGGQAGNIARMSWLAAGFPEHVPGGVTVDRQCGSSQQAVHFGAQAILSGTADLIVAGGVQNMSQIPISAAMIVGQQYGFDTPTSGSVGWTERYGDQEVSQFKGAEMIAEKWDISREELEKWALQSHERAKAAIAAGRFDNEIVAMGDATVDEGPRETSLEKMATLKVLVEDGRMTAAVASQISDGASALLLASAEAVEKYNLKPPRAGFITSAHAATTRSSCSVRRSRPRSMLSRSRPEHRRHRHRRDQRSFCPRSSWPGSRRSAQIRPRSTSTAARSHSVTRSARPAPS